MESETASRMVKMAFMVALWMSRRKMSMMNITRNNTVTSTTRNSIRNRINFFWFSMTNSDDTSSRISWRPIIFFARFSARPIHWMFTINMDFTIKEIGTVLHTHKCRFVQNKYFYWMFTIHWIFFLCIVLRTCTTPFTPNICNTLSTGSFKKINMNWV